MKFVEEEIVATYGFPKYIVRTKETKFDWRPVKDYAKLVGIISKHVVDYNPRGTSKVEQMVGTWTKAIKKISLSEKVDRDACVTRVVGGCHRLPGAEAILHSSSSS